ncbi:hypothetical protein HMPREF1545_03758 [Oscillibacter sp. KLE 1728]|nr:hypothetical protein HMPREF1545_03758 [Oscillibacter sp. KLE 1728]ERK64553.1 hypothetical protein HMPREF1546_01665 [Oscillibacter sp. KLE 1745]
MLDRVNDYRYNSTGNPWWALPWEERARMILSYNFNKGERVL